MSDSLEKLYYGLPNPSAYTGIDNLHSASRKHFKRQKVLEWLEGQDAYNSHRQVRRRFPRRTYNVSNLDDVWEMDLMDLRSLKTYNDGFSYLLTVIDVVSKYLWIEAVKDKTCKSVARAFEKILSRSGDRIPVSLQSDKGKEFTGKEMQQILKDRSITYRVARSPDIKAAVCERVIRTIKERLWRYFTHTNTRRYIDILHQIVQSYNHSKHSAIRMTPASVNVYNVAKAVKNLKQRYGRYEVRTPKYNVGDLVRVSRARNAFAKGYEGGWTIEFFKIDYISETRQPPVYHLKDLDDEVIDGFFYEEELSRVRKDPNTEAFQIEEILRTRGKGARKEFFVKWKGWPEKFNSWVRSKDLTSP